MTVGLLRNVVDLARSDVERPIVDLYDNAWGRQHLSGLPTAIPAKQLVGFVVRIARNYPDAGYLAVLNHARAGLLYRGLGGFEPETQAVDGIVEAALLESIIAVTAAHPEVRDFLDRAYVVTNEIWPLIVARRADRWDLPWPPNPRPDYPLLAMLVRVAIWDPTRLIPDELHLALASVPLQRSTEEQLGRIQQAATRGGDGEGESGMPKDQPGDALGAGKAGGSAALVITLGGLMCGIGKQFDGFDASAVGKMCLAARSWPVVGPVFGAVSDAVYGIGYVLSHPSTWFSVVAAEFKSDPIDEDKQPPPEPGPPMDVPAAPGDPNEGAPTDDIPLPGQPPKKKPLPADDSSFKPPWWYYPEPVVKPAGPVGKKAVQAGTETTTRTPDVSVLDSGPLPWDDTQFIVSLCSNARPVLGKYGFGVTEMLSVMESESGLQPWRSTLKAGATPNENTAMGINQMTVANVWIYEPTLVGLSPRGVYDEYTEWSRAQQLDVALKFFDAVLRGLQVGSYNELQRAAVLMYFNAGGNAHSKTEFNQAAGTGAFHGDWRVWKDPAPGKASPDKANIGLTYWRRTGPVDADWWKANAHVELQDLLHAMRVARSTAIIDNLVKVLREGSCL